MSLKTTGEFAEVLKTPKYLPSISLIMPIETKMGLKTELSYKLKMSVDKIEDQLRQNYPEEKATPVLKRLRKLVSELKYDTHKKTIAIYVSPLLEKVFYLDIPFEEKIIIDDSFEIRDLIYSKKQNQNYLLTILSGKESKVFLNMKGEFIPLTLNVPDKIEAYKNDINEKTANFSDESERKEILLDKFLHFTDNGLTAIILEHKLPLFVMGTEKTIGHFNTITHNANHVIDYITGNYESETTIELQKIMAPYIAKWKKAIQNGLMKKIDEAMSQKKLAYGIQEVWKASTEKKGKILVVEKNFMYPAQHGSNPDVIYKYDENLNNSFYIKDAVDDIIEKVLGSGGDVEFVDEGLLSEYGKIVLIEYYEFL